MEREEAASVLVAHADDLGTPSKIVDAVVERLRPSVRLVPAASAPDAGRSRIGGTPDVPNGFVWPRSVRDLPLAFLMQVDLAEVRAIDVGGHLPDSGLLQVFFEWHRSTPLLEEDCRVTVDTGARNDVSHADFPPDLETECQFAQFPLVPTLEWTIPGPDETGLENIPDDAIAFWDVAEEMLEVRQGFGPYWTPKHRMLGWADFIQSPGMVDDARLLLQVDSDPPSGCDWPARTGMMWGDCGRIYWITDEPGLKGDFTRISPFWECC